MKRDPVIEVHFLPMKHEFVLLRQIQPYRTEMAVYRLTFVLCMATASAFAPRSPPGFRGGSRFVGAEASIAKGRTYRYIIFLTAVC
jgi:hypothetical protein